MTNVQRYFIFFTQVLFIIVVFQTTITVGIVILTSMVFIHVAKLLLYMCECVCIYIFFIQYTWNEYIVMNLMLTISIEIL